MKLFIQVICQVLFLNDIFKYITKSLPYNLFHISCKWRKLLINVNLL